MVRAAVGRRINAKGLNQAADKEEIFSFLFDPVKKDFGLEGYQAGKLVEFR